MEYQAMAVLWSVLLFNLSLASSSNSILTLELGFVTPVNTTNSAISFLGKELFSIYKLAIEDVNYEAARRKSKIRLSQDFSGLLKNENSITCKATAKSFLDDKNVVGVVGAFSSECTISMQKQFKLSGSNLSQISYASTSAKLSDKHRYPTLFRTSSNDAKQAEAILDLIKHFRWKRVGLIGIKDKKGKGLMEDLNSRVLQHEITIAEKALFNNGDADDIIDARLQQLKDAGTRVNLVVAAGDDVIRLFERVKAKKMTGEGWVWIGSDGVASTWLGSDNQAVDGLVAISPKVPTGENLLKLIMSWFGKSTKDYPGRLWKLSHHGISPYDAQVYDAVFTYYYALENLARASKITKKSSISHIRSKLFNELKSFKDWKSGIRSITGGKVYFDIDGNTFDAPGAFDIINYLDGSQDSRFQISQVKVGSWNESGLNLPGAKIMWPGRTRKTPTDRGAPGKPLFKIGFIAPLHSGLGVMSKHGRELVSAAKVAVDMINNDKSQKIELDLKVMDEGMDGGETCRIAAQSLLADNVVAVVGGYRSSCSIAISKELALSKTPVISYASAASVLSNKKLHPYFFRTVPSNYYEAKVLAKLVKKYGFKKVGTLSSKQSSALETSRIFKRLMLNNSVEVRMTETFPVKADAENLRAVIKKIRESASHVNLISGLIHDSKSILQQLEEGKVTGKGWVWLATSGITSNLLQSKTKVAKSMEGFIGVGPTAGEGSIYLNFISSWLQRDPLKYPGVIHNLASPISLPYTPQVVDAVNAIALSLSQLITTRMIGSQSKHGFIKDKLYKKLKSFADASSGFPSASGTKSMYFDSSQDGPATIDVLNFVDSKWKKIGEYSGRTDQLSFTQDVIFPGRTTAPKVGSGKIIYTVAAFFPKDQRLGALSELGMKWENALKATLDWINKNQSLAIGFQLISLDGGNDGDRCGSLAQNLPADVDLVIGEYRSLCTESIYREMQQRHIPVISYGSTANMFSDKMKYPYLFRTCPSDYHQSKALSEVVRKLKWNKLGVISSNSIYGSGLVTAVTQDLIPEGVKITAKEEFAPSRSQGITNKLLKLKSSDAAVNLVISQPSHALRVYQEAFEQGMTGKGWTWLGSDGAVSLSFSNSQHLQQAMQGMVGFRPKSGRGDVYEAIRTHWKQRSESYEAPYVAQVMDAILAPSMALQTLHTRNVINEKTPKHDARNLMIRKLQQMKDLATGFNSATGQVSHFDRDQDSPGQYDMVNLNGNSWVTVGSFDSTGLRVVRNIIWPGGTMRTPPSTQPLDDKMQEPAKESEKSDTPLLAVSIIFGLFGVLVLAFMVYIIHRVRYRHLYMQSDVASGGLFSVLYGQNRRPEERYMQPHIQVMTHTNGHAKRDTEVTIHPNT